jgi:hypothetical protein
MTTSQRADAQKGDTMQVTVTRAINTNKRISLQCEVVHATKTRLTVTVENCKEQLCSVGYSGADFRRMTFTRKDGAIYPYVRGTALIWRLDEQVS